MGKRMARSPRPLTRKFYAIAGISWPGGVSALVLLLLIGATFAVLLIGSGPIQLIEDLGKDPYLRQVVGFTLWQATLSTLLSIGMAIPVARAFARQPSFPGRRLVLHLLSLPVVTPVIVAVLGIIVVYGQSGILRDSLELVGLSWSGRFYGLTGILVAHVFFNLPLSVRMLLPAWDRIPSENWRLAAQLGMNSRQLFRWLEWPALTSVLPGTATVVFLLCFSSFAVVLVLGGGPSSTTIEVAIYQALLGLHHWIRTQSISRGLSSGARYRPDTRQSIHRIFDLAIIGLTTTFIALPLAAIVYAGCTGPLSSVLLESRLWAAAGRSVGIAMAAAALALSLAAGLLVTSRHLVFQLRRRTESDILQIAGSITLAVPPMVTGTGLFLLLLPLGIAFDLAVLVIIVVNATLVLPYMMRTVGPAFLDAGHRYDRLCRQLGVSGWHRLRLVDWPIIRRPLGFAVALCATLSVGDMGVAALFDTSGAITLPVLLYHRLGAYRFDEAAVTALALIVLCAVVFLVVDRGIGRWHS